MITAIAMAAAAMLAALLGAAEGEAEKETWRGLRELRGGTGGKARRPGA